MSREIRKSSEEKVVTISCGCGGNRFGSFGCCGGLLGFNNCRRDDDCFSNRRRRNHRRHRNCHCNRRRFNSCC